MIYDNSRFQMAVIHDRVKNKIVYVLDILKKNIGNVATAVYVRARAIFAERLWKIKRTNAFSIENDTKTPRSDVYDTYNILQVNSFDSISIAILKWPSADQMEKNVNLCIESLPSPW